MPGKEKVSMSDSITFKYTLTEEDHARAWRIHNGASKTYLAIWLLAGGFIGLLAWGRVMAILDGEREWSSIFSMLLPVGIYVVTAWLSFSWRPRFLARQSPYRGLENNVTASETGVASSNALFRNEIQWGAYTHAIEKPDMFLLYTGRLLFYPFPRRCFENQEDADRFRDLIRAHIKNFRVL